MRRIGPSLIALATLSLVALFVAKWFGWLDFPALLNVSVAGAGLIGLVMLVKLPWDLYMQARALVMDQRDAARREIEVAAEEQRYAQRTARRLLALCVTLHVVTAAVIGVATWASQGQLGYWFAGFYLLSTFFRPAAALYHHLALRLDELRDRTRYPREDVVSLVARFGELEQLGARVEDKSGEDHAEALASVERLSGRVDALDREHRARTAAFEDQVAACLRELERTADKLTDDRDLLAGIRAFVKVVRQT
ncbi:MAG: hypothetical protein DRJ42_11620 [Deltaproteobacteria bacterium]|nr:MAG: hypothetical protein DRJ42_11620 [Deltaproteobacteria bacterium]